jgi:hypothetical protein
MMIRVIATLVLVVACVREPIDPDPIGTPWKRFDVTLCSRFASTTRTVVEENLLARQIARVDTFRVTPLQRHSRVWRRDVMITPSAAE